MKNHKKYHFSVIFGHQSRFISRRLFFVWRRDSRQMKPFSIAINGLKSIWKTNGQRVFKNWKFTKDYSKLEAGCKSLTFFPLEWLSFYSLPCKSIIKWFESSCIYEKRQIRFFENFHFLGWNNTIKLGSKTVLEP